MLIFRHPTPLSPSIWCYMPISLHPPECARDIIDGYNSIIASLFDIFGHVAWTPYINSVSEVYFTVRLIGKRKLAEDVWPPLDFLGISYAFTVSVGDQNFVVSAHRLMQILPVFRAMLTDEMREKVERKVEVKDAEPEHFRAFLEVIDPEQNVYPNPTNVVEVLKLADRYEMNLAKDRCKWHLLNCVEMPLVERLRLADIYGLNKLKDFILSIGSVKLRAFYLANCKELQEEGRFSKKLLEELIQRLCYNE